MEQFDPSHQDAMGADFSEAVLRDRFRGCLLGLAVGDALGTAVEFNPPGSFAPVTGMRGGGAFHLKPGEWTDDTSMALCLAESLLEKQGFDPRDQMERYCKWASEGYLSSTGRCFDIGNTVSGALARYRRTGEPYSGSEDPHSAGNGSLMRLAPVALAFTGDPALALEMAADSSRTTHAAPEAVEACRYYAGLMVGALRGVGKAELLSAFYSPVAGYFQQYGALSKTLSEVLAGSFKTKQPPEIKASGYVVRSLEAALWAFFHTQTFEAGCLLVVNLGDDADTAGAIYGQLAGAYYGASAIPAAWLEPLAMRPLITDMADRLLAGIISRYSHLSV